MPVSFEPLADAHQLDDVQSHPTEQVVTPAENALLCLWQPDIRRAAAKGVSRLRARPDDVDDLAQQASLRLLLVVRKTGITSERYVRKVIRNAVATGCRAERRAFTTLSARAEQLYDDIGAHGQDPTDERLHAITAWVVTLPPRLRLIHDMLYEKRITQAEAGIRLGVSQSRVAQLHRDLLKNARTNLEEVAA